MDAKNKDYHFSVGQDVIKVRQEGFGVFSYTLEDLEYEINKLDIEGRYGKIDRDTWETRRTVLVKAADLLTYGYHRGERVSYAEARQMIEKEGFHDNTNKQYWSRK